MQRPQAVNLKPQPNHDVRNIKPIESVETLKHPRPEPLHKPGNLEETLRPETKPQTLAPESVQPMWEFPKIQA